MPYKDPEKRREVNKKTRENLYRTKITVNIPKSDDPMYDHLVKAAAISNVSVAEYMRLATKEKLARDSKTQIASILTKPVAVTASPAELRTGITKSHRSRPRRRIRLGVIPDKPDKP